MKLEVKHDKKVYGFLRCSEESVPKLKILATQLGYPSMVKFLDELAEVPKSKFKEIFLLQKVEIREKLRKMVL